RTPATGPSPPTTASTAGTWTGSSGRRARPSEAPLRPPSHPPSGRCRRPPPRGRPAASAVPGSTRSVRSGPGAGEQGLEGRRRLPVAGRQRRSRRAVPTGRRGPALRAAQEAGQRVAGGRVGRQQGCAPRSVLAGSGGPALGAAEQAGQRVAGGRVRG